VTADLRTLLKTARTVSNVVAAIDAANLLADEFRKDDDLRLLRHAVEMRWRLERRGGELLKCSDSSGLGDSTAARWRKLAAMTEDEFDSRITAALARTVIAARGYCHSTAMVLSPWKKDRFGNSFRTLTAVEKSK